VRGSSQTRGAVALHDLQFSAAVSELDSATTPHMFPEPWGPPDRRPHAVLFCNVFNVAEDVRGMQRYTVVPDVGIRIKKGTKIGVNRGSLRVRVVYE